METVEQESKLELDEPDFFRLLGAGEVKKCVRQLNVYYDSDDLLAAAGATVRVRLSPGRIPLLTLKVPLRSEGARRDARELETPLGPTTRWRISERPMHVRIEDDLPAEYRAPLLALGVSELRRAGWMRNDRWVVRLIGHDVELDRTKLPNGETFFEAEIENGDLEVHQRLVSWIQQFAVSASPSQMSKFQRFAESMKRGRRR